MLADVGLIGFPNVGKSTLISTVSSATPKIANYHFTTLEPSLGVVRHNDKTFVMADIPGIIEGASSGAGLGIKFLKHVERTKLLLHVIDISGSEDRIPLEDYLLINKELISYSDKLSKKVQIVVANKCDCLNNDSYLKDLEKQCKKDNVKLFKISAITKEGINELLDYITNIIDDIVVDDVVNVDYTEDDNLSQEFFVTKEDNTFYVTGDPIERLMKKVNVYDVESRQYMQRVLNKIGVMNKLKSMGLKNEDTIDVIGYQMDYFE